MASNEMAFNLLCGEILPSSAQEEWELLCVDYTN
jgi:hypothetical protein